MDKCNHNREEFIKSVDDHIAKYGFSVVCVAGDIRNYGRGFMYTVGLAGIGLPEVYLAGSSPIQHRMVNALARKMQETGQVPHGQVDLGFTTVHPSGAEEDARFFVQDVRDIDKMLDECVKQSVERFGRQKVKVVQLLWSDTVNLLPIEDGYNWGEFPQEIA